MRMQTTLRDPAQQQSCSIASGPCASAMTKRRRNRARRHVGSNAHEV
jgi:hypothetical protein